MFNPLPIIITFAGIYMLIKLRFFFILHPIKTLRKAKSGLKNKGAFKSLTLALAGTLGVGNILGVSIGIMIGGPGTVFWLFLSTVFSCVLKYSETVLSSDHIKRDENGTHGGIFYVLTDSKKRANHSMAKVYAVSVILLSLVMGSALQSGAVIRSAVQIFDTPPTLIATIFTILILISIVGGTKIIEKIAEIIIPVATIIYIIMTLSIITIHHTELPTVTKTILKEAFNFKSAYGGLVGFFLSKPITQGYCRGLLSNEAGSGTSSISHSRSGVMNSEICGIMGIIEVIFDTAILCTLTAFTILTTTPDTSIYESGTELIMSSFTSSLGNISGKILAALIFTFAYSTVICWYFYGTETIAALGLKRYKHLYLFIFLTTTYFGFTFDENLTVTLTDALFFIATTITTFTIIKNSDRIKILSEKSNIKDYLKIKDNVSSREQGTHS